MTNKTRNARRRAARQEKKQSVDRVAGQGDYYSEKMLPMLRRLMPPGTFNKAGGRVGSALGALGGSTLGPAGSALGSSVGSRIGGRLGQSLSRLVGFGDYEVVTNSLAKLGGVIPPGEAIPSFGVMGASTRVRHREYLGDMVVPATPTAFNLSTYTVNPGDVYTFPWLSSIAVQYQQYKFDGLIFEFRTLSSDITSGGALGAVILASNYDVVQPAFTDKIQMENSQYAVSTKPSCSMIHTMECAPGQVANNLYYVRNTGPSVVAGQDNRFYDLANFQIATQGLPGSSGQVLGELWVSYDVQLFKPIINEAFEGAFVTGVTVSNTAIYGTAPTVQGNVVTAAGSTLTFLVPGQYLVSVLVLGSGIISGALSGTAAGITQVASVYPASGLSGTVEVAVKITAPNQTLTVNFSTATTVTSGQALVSLFSYAFSQ